MRWQARNHQWVIRKWDRKEEKGQQNKSFTTRVCQWKTFCTYNNNKPLQQNSGSFVRPGRKPEKQVFSQRPTVERPAWHYLPPTLWRWPKLLYSACLITPPPMPSPYMPLDMLLDVFLVFQLSLKPNIFAIFFHHTEVKKDFISKILHLRRHYMIIDLISA